MVSVPDGGADAVAFAQQLRHQVRGHEAGAAGHNRNVADLARHGGEREIEGPMQSGTLAAAVDVKYMLAS